MSSSLVSRKFSFFWIFFAALTIAIGAAVFGNFKSQAQSSKTVGQKPADISRSFVTVDEKELQHIQLQAALALKILDLNVVEKHGDLLIVAAENEQLLELTRAMHGEFHKCGGFIAHETLDEARKSIEENSFAAANQLLAEYTINNHPLVNSLFAEAQEPQIRETITRLSTDFPNRRYNTPSGLQSANWIKDKWTQLAAGRGDISVEFFNHPTVSPQPSVIMTVQGTTFPSEIVVIGGHQDSINGAGATVDAPGADDDASGIASMTEAIRVMIAKGFRPQRTVKFMAYAAEEIGLRGSSEIAADFQARGVNVIGVLQLDMTNYKRSDSPVDVSVINDYTNAAQNQFLKNLIAIYQPSLIVSESTCGYGCSDHASWFSRGYPASFPFEAPFRTYSNPFIHSTSDTIAQSGGNADHALKFTKIAVSFLVELAKGPVSISGQVIYGTTPANEPQKTVPGALVSTGTAATPATTGDAGSFLFQNLTPGGNFTVTASKTGGENGITAIDATLVLRYLAASGQGAENAFTANQLLAADANGDGKVTALDATQILRYAAGGRTNQTGNIGNWKFTPNKHDYSSLFNSVSNQNFTAVLIGEVNGSWTPAN